MEELKNSPKTELNQKRGGVFNKKTVNRQKIIRRLLRDLEIICVEVDPPRENYLEELLKTDWQKLSSCYDKNDAIIKELQEKINKIKKQENAQLNRDLAAFLCHKLLKREIHSAE